MSTDDLKDFERSMHEEIDAFLEAESQPAKPQKTTRPAAKKPQPPRASASEMKTGHIVKLAVRTKQLEMDTAFEYHSTSISKLEAQMEAEKAANKAGYPIIGYVIDIQRV
ncbi:MULTISPECIES: hypothetical protein [Halomonas]|uniref:Uncharacterized protein n=1 Tax=Halomonas salina TaxID=42565 RepID=A0ABR4WUD5_9GAMM|nr:MULTISPECIES: hypothetical protein [Halomonas]KGE78169.1 hypothetical protein FP66_04820 [Halomonas salina]RAH38049.1 hypothetical protein C9J49_006350 [Halomonas sp. SL1]